MNQPSNVPTRKMAAVGVAGALTTVIITISRDVIGYEMSADLASAITTIITFVAGYLTPNSDPLATRDDTAT
jgi:hypothetical protein